MSTFVCTSCGYGLNDLKRGTTCPGCGRTGTIKVAPLQRHVEAPSLTEQARSRLIAKRRAVDECDFPTFAAIRAEEEAERGELRPPGSS